MYFVINNDYNNVVKVLNGHQSLINQMNNKKETSLVVAIKLEYI